MPPLYAGIEGDAAERGEGGAVLLHAGDEPILVRIDAAAQAHRVRRARHLLGIGDVILVATSSADAEPDAISETRPTAAIVRRMSNPISKPNLRLS